MVDNNVEESSEDMGFSLDSAQEDDNEDEDGASGNEFDQLQSELRERAIKLGKKRKYYEYIESTSEWTEKNYYGQNVNDIKVKQFWIDYLENDFDVFVSGVSKNIRYLNC